jgi:hypothetical protein
MPATFPTAYSDVNALLHLLLCEVQAQLEGQFVALYLHGSLASGDFSPERSDIDFVVVTTSELPPAMLPVLGAMHERIRATGLKWVDKLEGSYFPQQAIRRYDPERAHHPALRMDGSFDIDHHASDWVIQLHLIREQGIVLAGPAPQTLIDPVPPDELRRAVSGVLREWWAPMLQDPFRLRSRHYQAYAVLTMCRALYTLEHGTVVPKEIAARWAQEALSERWGPVIDRALDWPRGLQPDESDQALALIRHTLGRAGRSVEPSTAA